MILPKREQYVEAIVATVFALAIPYFFISDDPLLLDSSIDWPVLIPILLALRYGFIVGFLSIFTVVCFHAWCFHAGTVVYVDGFDKVKMGGYLVLTMLVGEFADKWVRKNQQLSREAKNSNEQLADFSTSYFLLQSSHHRLEQLLAGYSLSLAESLETVKRELFADNETSSYGTVDCHADEILDLFVEYGGVQCAALHRCNSQQKFQSLPSAVVGTTGRFTRKDFRVCEAIESRKLITFSDDQFDNTSQYQACIPIVDSDDFLYGMIVVEQFHFFSLKNSNFTLISVIANYIGNILREKRRLASINSPLPAFLRSPVNDVSNINHPLEELVIELRLKEETVKTKRLFDHILSERSDYDSRLLLNPTRLLVTPKKLNLRGIGPLVSAIDRWCVKNLHCRLEQIGVQVKMFSGLQDTVSEQEIGPEDEVA